MTTDDSSGNAPGDGAGKSAGNDAADEPADGGGRRPRPVASPPNADGPDPFAGEDWTAQRQRRRDQPSTRPGMKRVRKRLPSRRRLAKRRRLGTVLLIVGGLIVLGGIWIAVTALLARSSLNDARTQVATLRAQIDRGDFDAARATARELAENTGDAHDYTTGPAWAIASAVPGLQAVDTVRTVAAQTDVLANDVLPQLVDASRTLDPATLRDPDGRVNIQRIASVTPVLDSASNRAYDAAAAIAAEPGSGIGPVDSATKSLLDQLVPLVKTLRSADLAAHITPPLLGQGGEKRYFVAFQNNAEARGTGGLPGAFGIITANNGKVDFERFESDSALAGVRADVDFGARYDALYPGNISTGEYRNGNLSPHFPYAAQIWMSMWQQKSGEKLDGAFALDPEALSYLLDVTGPTRTPGGVTVTGDNVVPLTQKTAYDRFGSTDEQNSARRKFLLAIAKAASTRIITSAADPAGLVRAGAKAAGERRLLIYSADPDVQSYIAQTSASGEIPETSDPYVGVAINSYGQSKISYYLDRTIQWRRDGCGSTRDVTVTIRLRNSAPRGLLPYVTGDVEPSKATYPDWRPGDLILGVSYFATDGAQLVDWNYDGPGTDPSTHPLRGHPVFTGVVVIPRGTTHTITLKLKEPAGSGSPIVMKQPLVRSLKFFVDDSECG